MQLLILYIMGSWGSRIGPMTPWGQITFTNRNVLSAATVAHVYVLGPNALLAACN